MTSVIIAVSDVVVVLATFLGGVLLAKVFGWSSHMGTPRNETQKLNVKQWARLTMAFWISLIVAGTLLGLFFPGSPKTPQDVIAEDPWAWVVIYVGTFGLGAVWKAIHNGKVAQDQRRAGGFPVE